MATDALAQVCNLQGEELEKRRAMIQTEIAPHVKRTEGLSNGRAWEFDEDPVMRAKLERLIELERRCCGGLTWNLEAPDGSDTIRLVVEGTDPRSELFASFRDLADAGPGAPS